MKMLHLTVVKTWLCATGVAIVATYCICTNRPDTPAERQKLERVAERMAKHGTIPEYKSQGRHSSAVKKTTAVKVTAKEDPKYVPNPLYPAFTNAWNALIKEYADCAQDGEVLLTEGFVLAMKDGKPHLQFPEEYARIGIGGLAMGDVLTDADGNVHRKRIDGTDQEKMGDIGIDKYRRLKEPEFYCTDVTYAVLPSTRQIDAIQMHGNLTIGNTSTANKMVDEITNWMAQDYGAVDLKETVPAGTLALKKFRIGAGMNVEVRVNWKRQRTDEGCDADIHIAFTTSELADENRYQRQKLGEATDAARASTLDATGVNYFSVRPTVTEDAVKNKVVY